MATSNNTPQPQPGPVAQQLTKLQANGHKPSVKKDKWGLADKTFWDWLPLLIQLLGALAIPIAIAFGTAWFSYQQSQTLLQTTIDQQRETTLKTYLDDIKDLLLNRGLKISKPDDEVRVLADTETFSALEQLDSGRAGILIHFLSVAGLVTSSDNTTQGDVIITLYDVNLSGVNVFALNLRGADLTGADLDNSTLAGAVMNGAVLDGATLKGAVLDLAFLNNTSMVEADLQDASLRSSYLKNANLSHANLQGANLNGANMKGADLSYTNLRDVKVTKDQLAQAGSLKGATMPDGSIHP